MLSVCATIGLAVGWGGLLRCRAALRGTTLTTAWWTAAGALGFWTSVWFAAVYSATTPAVESRLWHLASVAALCPLVAVLGARRPVNNVWPAFVLLPLVFVLGMPALTSLWRGGAATLRIETPSAVGFALVLVMGAGNYLFTRLSLPALFVAAAVALPVFPLTDFGSGGTPADFAGWSGVCVGLAGSTGWLLMRRRDESPPPHERIWTEFRNLYGVVWAKRVMDRINWTAHEERWPARLELSGLVWTGDDVDEAERRRIIARLEHTFGWLLKRFVDARWIAERGGG